VELTPRERVHLSLAHRDSDRVPVDFMATPEAWQKLQIHLGLADREEILRYLGIDFRHPRQPYVGPPLINYSDGSWVDAWGVRRRQVHHEGGAYDEIVAHPLSTIENVDELQGYAWPQPEWWDAKGLAEEIRRLDAGGDYAIALEEFGDPGGIFEIASYLRGMEQFMVDLVMQPLLAFEIMQHITDFYMGMLDRVMAATGDRIDLIWTSDDIAHQHGSLISRRLWEELIVPHHARLNRRIHELGSRVMYHSCGAVKPFIPGLIEIGVDVLDVLQFSADGMNPREIKAEFGDRLCFHGGMDVQTTLPGSTEPEVRQIARERITVLGRNGGYVLAPTHNIQVDTPPANMVAMYVEAGSVHSGAGGCPKHKVARRFSIPTGILRGDDHGRGCG
jgi:uroporphyrinogen decarboxylase